MTIRKNMRRPVLRRGIAKLGREEVADLEAFFRGETASAWCVILPGPDYSEEIRERWREWQEKHPGAPMPDGLAGLLGHE